MPIYDTVYNYALKQKEIVEYKINNLETILKEIEPKNLVDKNIANSIINWMISSIDRDIQLLVEFIPETNLPAMSNIARYCIVDHQDNSIRVCELDRIRYSKTSLGAINHFFKSVMKILERHISKDYLDRQLESTEDLDIDSYTIYTIYPDNTVKVNNYQEYSGLGKPNVTSVRFSYRNRLLDRTRYVFKEEFGYETDYFTYKYRYDSESAYMVENSDGKFKICPFCHLPPVPERGTPYEFGDLIALGVAKFVKNTEDLIYISLTYSKAGERVEDYYLLPKANTDYFGDYPVTKKNSLKLPAKLVKYFSDLHKMFGLTEEKVTILDLNTISTPDKQLSLIQKCKELYGEPDKVINQVMNYKEDK